jgi:hypothetical protein
MYIRKNKRAIQGCFLFYIVIFIQNIIFFSLLSLIGNTKKKKTLILNLSFVDKLSLYIFYFVVVYHSMCYASIITPTQAVYDFSLAVFFCLSILFILTLCRPFLFNDSEDTHIYTK